jgi:hypothetical protein
MQRQSIVSEMSTPQCGRSPACNPVAIDMKTARWRAVQYVAEAAPSSGFSMMVAAADQFGV